MGELPERKQNRIEHYDYATPGGYFVTLCTAGRERLFWDGSAPPPDTHVGADIISPAALSSDSVGTNAKPNLFHP